MKRRRLLLSLLVAALVSAPPVHAASVDSRYVSAHARPLDWARLLAGPERVIYIGESHSDRRVKDELRLHMDEIRAAGFTHFGIETGDDRQPLLDAYSDGTISADEFAEILERTWSYPFRPFRPMWEAARAKGLRLVALDIPDKDVEAMDRLCVVHTPPPICAGDDNLHMRARDDRMASNISRVLSENSGARVLALVGISHAGHSMQPAALLRLGWPSRSYMFGYGWDACSKAARELGIDSGRLYVDTPAESAPEIQVGLGGGTLRFHGCIVVPPEPRL
ncbi:MAG: ChaN family lipoprotein [Elusimicrobia bacterium]|nr:ChaN family lipoprotein [Elusimicrobiota bacterium]